MLQVISNVDYFQVAYNGVETIIGGLVSQSALACIRENAVVQLREQKELNKLLLNCGSNIIINFIFSDSFNFNSKYYQIIKSVAEKNPSGVTKNLIHLGFDKSMIEWLSAKIMVDLTNSIE